MDGFVRFDPEMPTPSFNFVFKVAFSLGYKKADPNGTLVYSLHIESVYMFPLF